jgi:hypothetical protein
VEEVLYVTEPRNALTVARHVRAGLCGVSSDVARTVVAVDALGSPELLVEIACTAYR